MNLMWRVSSIAFVAAFGFTLLVNAQSPAFNNQLFISSIHTSGTRSLDTAQLNEIVGPLNQVKAQNSDEIKQRIRFQFQEHGYFDVEVKSVSVRRLDPLADPTPVDVEADVLEGPRFVFGDIQFTGIQALSADKLRTKFPIHPGDWFSRGVVSLGIEALMNAFVENGYMDAYAVPDAVKAGDAKINLHVEVHEGGQYRMGKLQFAGNTQDGEQLRARWELEAGKPFDGSYLKRFLTENSSLLPAQFEMGHSTKIARDCQNHTVTVYIELGPDHPNVTPPNDNGCDEESKSPSNGTRVTER